MTSQLKPTCPSFSRCGQWDTWQWEQWWYVHLLGYALESLFGGSSRGVQLLVYPWPKTGPPLAGMVVLFDRARSFGRDAHGAVREEGDTRLASQISRINPGDQWGDRCRNQIALTSWVMLLKEGCFSPPPTFPFHGMDLMHADIVGQEQ